MIPEDSVRVLAFRTPGRASSFLGFSLDPKKFAQSSKKKKSSKGSSKRSSEIFLIAPEISSLKSFSSSLKLRMLSIRSFARIAPRALSRASSPSCIRPLSTVSQPSFLLSSWRLPPRRSCPAFSTYLPRREPAGECRAIYGPDNLQWLTVLKRSRSRALRKARTGAILGEGNPRLQTATTRCTGIPRQLLLRG